jgi:CRP-like cAMP-binding protein
VEDLMPHPDPSELAHIPLFVTLTATELAALAQHLEVEPFRPGNDLVTQGASGYAFYVLRDGAANVTRDGRIVGTLRRGDFFGEIALLDDGRRHATVTATEPGTAWCMFGTAFRVLQAQHPEIASAIHDVAIDRELVDR